MTFYGEMQRAAETLRARFVKSILPDPEDGVAASLSVEQYETYKREVSFAHLRRIRSPATFGLLVMNLDKYGLPDYIGPSTFAEIAVAAVCGKKIFLIGDYPEVYAEELAAWRAVRLFGRFERLADEYRRECAQPSPQMMLFNAA